MQYKFGRIMGIALVFVLVVSFALAACSSPTPQAPQVVKETVIVAGFPQVVERVVTATPLPAPTQSTGPKRGGTLNVIIAEEVKGLYNQADSGTEGEYPLNQITDGLVNADPDRNIIPGLATSWEVSPDGLTYTFKLRQGVKFHDGTEFDADDVKWTFDEGIKPGRYSGGKYVPYIAGTEKIDKYTVKITLKQPWADFMPTLAYEEDLDIMARESVEKWGVDYGFKASVGTGPFKFDHWTRGQELVLVRNEDYWDKAQGYPYLDKIVYRAVTEDAVKMMQLSTKNVDIILTVPFNFVAALKLDKNVVVDSTAGGTVHWLGFATENAPFKDLKTRQALCYD
jgi:peptide/nickel transport system substrate-binding protein